MNEEDTQHCARDDGAFVLAVQDRSTGGVSETSSGSACGAPTLPASSSRKQVRVRVIPRPARVPKEESTS
jgi:hypothetical protein